MKMYLAPNEFIPSKTYNLSNNTANKVHIHWSQIDLLFNFSCMFCQYVAL